MIIINTCTDIPVKQLDFDSITCLIAELVQGENPSLLALLPSVARAYMI